MIQVVDEKLIMIDKVINFRLAVASSESNTQIICFINSSVENIKIFALFVLICVFTRLS